MSFQGATAGFHIDEQKTTLHLTGGRDCIPYAPLSTYTADLWVRGGGVIEKRLAVLGNIHTESLFVGNLCSEVALIETLSEKYVGESIRVVGNIELGEEDILFAPTISTQNITGNGDLTINNLGDLYIIPSGNIDFYEGELSNVRAIRGASGPLNLIPNSGQYVVIAAGEGLSLDNRDICNVDTLKAGNVQGNVLSATALHTEMLTTPLIKDVETIFGNGSMLFCTDGDIEIKPQGGNLILHNAAISFDLEQNILSNVMAIKAGVGTTLDLKTGPGFKVTIAEGDGLDLQGRDICNIGNLMVTTVSASTVEVDTIRALDDMTITIAANIITQGNIEITDILYVSNIAPVTINGNLIVQDSLTLGNALTVPNGGTGLTTYVKGDLLYAYTASSLHRLAAGTAGQILTMASEGGLPQWNSLTEQNGGTGQTSYATGDMIYASAPNTLAKRSAGSAGQFLTMSGGVPVWTALTETNGGTGQSTYATGDMIYSPAANTLGKLPAGSANQVLTMSGGVPTWATSISLLNEAAHIILLYNTSTTPVDSYSNTVPTPQSWLSFYTASPGAVYQITQDGFYFWSAKVYHSAVGPGFEYLRWSSGDTGDIGMVLNPNATTYGMFVRSGSNYLIGGRANVDVVGSATITQVDLYITRVL